MYGHEKKEDNINFESNPAESRRRNYERALSKRQDIRLVKNTGKPIQGKVVQKTGEEFTVAYDEDVLAVKRGNVRRDIIETGGKSYYLVQEIPAILAEIAQNLDVLCADADMYASMGRDAEQIVDDIKELEPFIHALVVKYLKAGNCLDFAKLVFAKLVEKNYGKWVYQCYLDKKGMDAQRDDEFPITVRYKKGAGFDILNPKTYSIAEIKYKGKYIQFEKYVNGNNPTGYSLRHIDSAIYVKREEINGDLIEAKYVVSTLRFRQKDMYDHAFVITYPDKVNTISEMDTRKAIVVDSWGGLSPRTLWKFLNKGNPYKADLATGDIKIADRQQSGGNPFNFPKIEKMVQTVVDKHINDVVEKKGEAIEDIYIAANDGESIDRVYG